MRAGLLSDPRVVALLRELFVPVHISALNTLHCLRDPRDADLLRAAIAKDTDDFDGGEREAFLQPDGTMSPVFLSLHGRDLNDWQGTAAQYTAAGRRADAAVSSFREHGAGALRTLHGELPSRWHELWDDEDATVRAIAAAAPRWPVPAPGESAFRVFSRNSYRMYDDLHGVELAAIAPADVAAWLRPLAAGERRVVLPRPAFVTLARAMVPRGMVDTELAEASIQGELVLVVERTTADGRIEGRIEGRFGLVPSDKAEVGKRLNAACLFRSGGAFGGRFTFDRGSGVLRELRAVATDVEFAWLPAHGSRDDEFEPWHRVAIEWVRTPL